MQEPSNNCDLLWCPWPLAYIAVIYTPLASRSTTAALHIRRHGQQQFLALALSFGPASPRVIANPARFLFVRFDQHPRIGSQGPPNSIQHRPQRKSWFRASITGMRSLAGPASLLPLAPAPDGRRPWGSACFRRSGRESFVLDRFQPSRASHARVSSFFNAAMALALRRRYAYRRFSVSKATSGPSTVRVAELGHHIQSLNDRGGRNCLARWQLDGYG